VVIKPVPPGATVVGIPGRIVEDHHNFITDLEHGKLPDPVAEAIKIVLKEQDKLEDRLSKLETLNGVTTVPDIFKDKRLELAREFNDGGGI
jgi:serine O-acetyltransferase